MVVDDPEYYEKDYEVEQGGYVEEAMSFDELIATGGLFEEAGADSGLPDAVSAEEDTVQSAQDETALSGEETEEEFEESSRFIESIGVFETHVFPFSARKGAFRSVSASVTGPGQVL